jgi:hypothetical protein
VREAAQVTTKRLRLARVAVGDADELFVLGRRAQHAITPSGRTHRPDNQGPRPDPSDGQIRLAYSDRPLD